MFLSERLFGVLIYSFILFSVYLMIYSSQNKNLGKILLVYTFLLSLMGFFFTPNPGSDLYRIIPIMNLYASYNFKEIIDLSIESNTAFALIYLHLIGKTGVASLLPAITAFIVFTNIFYIIKKAAQKYSINSGNTALVLFFTMSTGFFIEAISGIRTVLAFSIVAICFYKEIEEKKLIIKNLVWYFIASLIHPIALFIVLLRFLFIILQREKHTINRLLSILLSFLFVLTLYLFGNIYIDSMILKAQDYFRTNRYSYFWEYLLGVLSLFTITLTQIIMFGINRKSKITDNVINIYRFSVLISVICIVVMVEYNTFHRMVIFNIMLSIPLFIYTLNTKKFSGKNKLYYKFFLILISLIMLLIASSRGNLSSLKFFII
ncbi:EpsG family protein [Planococcus chinensis]|uniref:EpsG family protein n=1 Tax=Planococcus chinensis TaxID=272917 RepID=A0ABW4QEF4_9BACL